MKKNLAYFLGISSNFAFAAGNVAIAINKYSKSNDYDIVIYYSSLDKRDEEALKKIPNCILKQFILDSQFADFMMRELPKECRFKTYDRLMCFSHYEAFNLLEEYRHVIWLDADILIQEDISEITKWGPIGFSEDGKRKIADQFVYKPECKYNLENSAIQIGLMILEDIIPYKKMYEYCYEKTWKYAHYLLNPEQAIINLLLQEFQLEPTIIPENIHCDCSNNKALQTWIVHFGTDVKVWNNYERYDTFPEWYRNHKKWLELGGSESKDYTVKSRPPRNLLEVMRLQKENPFFFKKVPVNSKIVIYGGGAIGHLYVEQLKATEYCDVIAVLDKNADKIEDLGDLVMIPEKIQQISDYDYVVISLEDKKRILEIRNMLDILEVPKSKIISR